MSEPKVRIDLVGGPKCGEEFKAPMDANVLSFDEYEEGVYEETEDVNGEGDPIWDWVHRD